MPAIENRPADIGRRTYTREWPGSFTVSLTLRTSLLRRRTGAEVRSPLVMKNSTCCPRKHAFSESRSAISEEIRTFCIGYTVDINENCLLGTGRGIIVPNLRRVTTSSAKAYLDLGSLKYNNPCKRPLIDLSYECYEGSIYKANETKLPCLCPLTMMLVLFRLQFYCAFKHQSCLGMSHSSNNVVRVRVE